ncbi:NUMOD4 domain-containing protein [Chryseobacterium sp.]|uniref:NUMOD4 domain-containing protein n=1 Tax=Chryseobacterium sp. TaxID=1871047 RepID=UPI0028970F9B|nr:NUMOD4 domain-containing protein [Chryseobacterium sp.]
MEQSNYNLKRSVEDLPGEIWEFIPGYDFNYQISNLGRVKSLVANKILILKKTLSNGKLKVLLYYKTGRYKNELVGRLVCSAFNGEPEENDVVLYKDGNRLNDTAVNTMWQSRKDSIANTFKTKGFPNKGDSNGMAKLNSEKVREIRRLRSEGNSYQKISLKYGVSISSVQNAVNFKTWKNI